MRIPLAKSALVLCAIGLLGAHAQDDTPDPYFEAARELVRATGMEHTLEETLKASMRVQMEANPVLWEFEDIYNKWIEEHLTWDKFEDGYIRLYMEFFTEQEIRELTEWYKTPLGTKTMTVLPQLFEKGGQLGMRIAQENMGPLMDMVEEQMASDLNEQGIVN
ncbi:MAG: DUF2059 domain-containing protein [Phycisphaerales bacterium JB043]